MFGIARALPAELLAQDRVIRIVLGDTPPQELLRPPVRFGNLRSIRLVIHGHVLPERQDEAARLPRERQGEFENLLQGRFGHPFYFALPGATCPKGAIRSTHA